MNKNSFISFTIFFLFLLFSENSNAQELVWRPVNPSFGGNPFNAEWLLSQAQVQDKLKDESSLDIYGRDPLDDFKESLNRQILSQISRQLVSNTFGEEGITDGHYELGDFAIDITSTADGISISIFDFTTGGQTNILVPYF
ncbi:MAG: curli production assembly/transport component CsgF [Ignavibacteriales bacterium]|nr:MAG: curli production assembly/transport component CsgF [Ignavibacteriales bacterium]